MGRVIENNIKPLDLDADLEAEDADSAGDDVADVANAKSFATQHRDRLKYCALLGGWLIWQEKYWAVDPDDQVMKFAILTARSLFADVEAATDLERRKTAFKAYAYANRRTGLRAMIDLARHMLAVSADVFDRDPFALNCLNGTLDLRMSKLRAHDPADCITKLIELDYDPQAGAPRWLTFLAEVLRDGALISYVQRAIGYSVTGDQRAECMFVAVGDGANGKGVFFDLIREAIGPYGSTGRPELLIRQRFDDNKNNEDVAMLRGRRLVEVSETGERHELNEEQTKNLTGRDKVKASMKYESLREWDPTHHIWLRTNNKPIIRGTEYAIWRRLKLILFIVKFKYASERAALIKSGKARKDDPLLRVRNDGLRDALRKELPGILAWVVKGAALWWNGGKPDLREPKIVTDAVEEYRSEMDRLSQFIDECCDLTAGEPTLTRVLYAGYKTWALEKGWKPWADNTFGQRLGKAGFKAVKIGTKNGREGLRLKPWDPAADNAVQNTEENLKAMSAKVRGAQRTPRS